MDPTSNTTIDVYGAWSRGKCRVQWRLKVDPPCATRCNPTQQAFPDFCCFPFFFFSYLFPISTTGCLMSVVSAQSKRSRPGSSLEIPSPSDISSSSSRQRQSKKDEVCHWNHTNANTRHWTMKHRPFVRRLSKNCQRSVAAPVAFDTREKSLALFQRWDQLRHSLFEIIYRWWKLLSWWLLNEVIVYSWWMMKDILVASLRYERGWRHRGHMLLVLFTHCIPISRPKISLIALLLHIWMQGKRQHIITLPKLIFFL